MASFIENLRNNLTNWFDRGQSNIAHINPSNQPQSYSTVILRDGERDPSKVMPYGAQYNTPGESRKAYDSLRRGETVKIDNGEEVKGGIYGTRFLGNNPNDFMSPDYFSDNDVSSNYKPIEVTLKGGKLGKDGIKLRAYYDDKGAIAQIDVSDMAKFDNDGNYQVTERHRGANDISQYFKSLGWSSEDYTVTTPKGESKKLSDFIPTTLLGSGAYGNYSVNDSGNKRWTLKNSNNRKAFEEYYSRYVK